MMSTTLKLVVHKSIKGLSKWHAVQQEDVDAPLRSNGLVAVFAVKKMIAESCKVTTDDVVLFEGVMEEDPASEAAETIQIDRDFATEINAVTFYVKPPVATEDERASKRTRDDEFAFDLQKVLAVKMNSKWFNAGKLSPYFVGRENFFEQLKGHSVAVLDTPPEGIQDAFSIVYATLSGAGKTVSMLRCKEKIKTVTNKDGEIVPVITAYLGFNCSVPLDDREAKLIKECGNYGADRVLARRLLCSVIASVNNPDAVTQLPLWEELYAGQGFPDADHCLKALGTFLATKGLSKCVIIAGVDEVQKIDVVGVVLGTIGWIDPTDGKEKTRVATVGLGQYFLRMLRRWQSQLHRVGIHIVSLGTGIMLDFRVDGTEGIVRHMLQSLEDDDDATLLTRDQFTKVVERHFEEQHAGNPPLICNRTAAEVARIVSVLFWPRVRKVLKTNITAASGAPAGLEPNTTSWGEWLKSWIVDIPIPINTHNYKLLPGRVNDTGRSSIDVAFELLQCGDDEAAVGVIVHPDAANADEIKRAIAEHFPLSVNTAYDALVIPSLGGAFTLSAEEFEKRAFSCMCASLRVGLAAIRDTVARVIEWNPADKISNPRIGLAAWVWRKCEQSGGRAVPRSLAANVPKVVGLVGVSTSFPFANSAWKGEAPVWSLDDVARTDLKASLSSQVPLFIRGGKDARCDFAFIYPVAADRVVALVVDSKHTTSSSATSLDAEDQLQMYDAAARLCETLAVLGVTVAALRLMFITNRDYVSTPKEKGANAIAEAYARLSKCVQHDVELESLHHKNFDFGPFSALLFARQFRDGQEGARRPQPILPSARVSPPPDCQ